MLRPLMLAALLLAGGPALAAQEAPSASLYGQQQSRSLSVQNWSSQDITSARVRTTDGKTWNIGKGSIPSKQASEILVPARNCIADIDVRLKNGRNLTDTGLHDCRNTQIVVRDTGVTIPQQAVPGGQQHGTPR